MSVSLSYEPSAIAGPLVPDSAGTDGADLQDPHRQGYKFDILILSKLH
jgi:hypothetical protein